MNGSITIHLPGSRRYPGRGRNSSRARSTAQSAPSGRAPLHWRSGAVARGWRTGGAPRQARPGTAFRPLPRHWRDSCGWRGHGWCPGPWRASVRRVGALRRVRLVHPCAAGVRPMCGWRAARPHRPGTHATHGFRAPGQAPWAGNGASLDKPPPRAVGRAGRGCVRCLSGISTNVNTRRGTGNARTKASSSGNPALRGRKGWPGACSHPVCPPVPSGESAPDLRCSRCSRCSPTGCADVSVSL